ncbi:MAG TPA: ABC transporter permease [Pyrinomonadaceae bacterium]
MGTLLQDLRYGFRMLWKSPGFTLVAVLTLALGIGANSAIFSGVSAFILRPLPIEEPSRLVRLFEIYNDPNDYNGFSYPDYLEYRDQNRSFEGILGYRMVEAALSNSDQNDVIWGELVTGNYFDVLHVRPAVGRAFLPEEDQSPGARPVVVLSHSLWQRRFNADPAMVGTTVTLNGLAYTVVGIAPKEFVGTKFALSMDFWVPMMMQAEIMRGDTNRLNVRGDHWFSAMGRLKPGVTTEQAEAEMTALAGRLEQAYPTERDKNGRVIVRSEIEGRFEESAGTVTLGATLALALIGMVLLIACANVANLLLARAITRRREIGIRLALGASRSRLIRQLLTESVMLSMLGGTLGLLLAFWATDWMQGFIPVIPYTIAFDFSPDIRALSFTLAVSVLTGIIFGLAPALQASNPDVVPVLKGETPTAGHGWRRLTLRNLLVISQVALALVVLVCGALFIKSARNARAIDPGFTTKNVLAVSMNPSLLGYTEEQSKQFYRQLVERVEALPGVESASVSSLLPLGDSASSRGPVVAEGQQEPPPGNESVNILANFVGPKHFETLQTPLLAGRDFSWRDDQSAPAVIIVNETLAERYWPGESAIGHRLRVGDEKTPYREVVGVARDSKYRSIGENPKPYMYLPVLQNYRPALTLVARTAGDPAALVGGVRREVQALDPRLPIYDIKTMKEHMTYALWAIQMGASLSTAFGLLALLLAATGLYSVMAYMVSQRTREIGIRMALGAQKGDVLKMVTRQGMTLALVGVGLGLIVASVATRILSSLLYGVSATDLVIFVGIPMLLATVALLACYIPARKATKVDPMVALRYE